MANSWTKTKIFADTCVVKNFLSSTPSRLKSLKPLRLRALAGNLLRALHFLGILSCKQKSYLPSCPSWASWWIFFMFVPNAQALFCSPQTSPNVNSFFCYQDIVNLQGQSQPVFSATFTVLSEHFQRTSECVQRTPHHFQRNSRLLLNCFTIKELY